MIQGLPLMSAVFRVDDHEKLVEMMRTHITKASSFADRLTSGDDHWLDDAAQSTEQDERAENWPSERDFAQNTRATMIFDIDSLDHPPLAWNIIWGDQYSNLFGWYIPKDLRLWGYVIWDAQRLDADVKELLMTQWRTKWPSHEDDPRDFFRYEY